MHTVIVSTADCILNCFQYLRQAFLTTMFFFIIIDVQCADSRNNNQGGDNSGNENQEESSDNVDSNQNVEHQNEIQDFCDNCNRCNIQTDIDEAQHFQYKMALHLVQSTNIKKRRRFKHIDTIIVNLNHIRGT